MNNILEYPDAKLRDVSQRVTAFDDDLKILADELFRKLDAHACIGLSAPQIGKSVRVSVVHVKDDDIGPMVYVNPEIKSKSGIGLVEESCLSIPDVVANVFRAANITVNACDISGKQFEIDLTGMHAVCLQHEIDHLDGKLFIDKLSWIRRFMINQRIKKKTKMTESLACK